MDAVKLNPQDAGSIRAVELIDQPFLIDAQARQEKTDQAARHLLPGETFPLLAKIREHILATSKPPAPQQGGQRATTPWRFGKAKLLPPPSATGMRLTSRDSTCPVALDENRIHIGSLSGPRVAAILPPSKAAAGSPSRAPNQPDSPGPAHTSIQNVTGSHPKPGRPRRTPQNFSHPSRTAVNHDSAARTRIIFIPAPKYGQHCFDHGGDREQLTKP